MIFRYYSQFYICIFLHPLNFFNCVFFKLFNLLIEFIIIPCLPLYCLPSFSQFIIAILHFIFLNMLFDKQTLPGKTIQFHRGGFIIRLSSHVLRD